MHIQTEKESCKILGMALGSGAAFGLAHIGVLRVFEQNKIDIDIMSGSSIGALIAGMWGLGFSSEKIEHIAERLRKKLNIIRLLDFTVPISSILAGKRLKRFLRGVFGEKTFEDLKMPVKIVAYDLANRETVTIEKGLIREAVYRSIAVPGIFKPVIEKERMIVDGGVSDPVPVDVLLKYGAQKIIAVNVLHGPEDIHKRNNILKERSMHERDFIKIAPFYLKIGFFIRCRLRKIFTPNIFDIIMTSMQSIEYVMAENSCKTADLSLHPIHPYLSSIDFHRVKDFIKTGEEEAMLHLEEIKKLMVESTEKV